MSELLTALAVFIVFHAVPAIGPVRRTLVAKLGMEVYIVGYSVLSILVLTWVAMAYAHADTDIVWPQWPWTRWVPLLTMPWVCLFLVATFSEPNPLSVGVKAKQFDSAHPGTVSITRHPLIWALLLWSGAHLFPNGDTASILLFGLFATLALMGPISLDIKKRHELGEDEWQRLSAATSTIPFWAILSGKTRLDLKGIGLPRIAIALAIYATLLGLHPWLIGVSPLPL
ncbi:NnrU family protein [Magnetovibrio blakemorei]|uniref:NnrU domain-containing protein n=1 Tax=Magnetovibrio blakemorei TaxID=28181 RepID=A0A1E5Q3A1_9PROT|nr:NnrU family protein [Magnetovibrio blakemorei]OEJ64037.1 hypothetical protein BEN30_01115 [Magnetovibrio blakemorei]